MSSEARAFGVVGLGRMGGGLALQALAHGMRVVGYAPEGAGDELTAAGLVDAGSLAELASRLAPPRVVLLYIPAGPAVDQVLTELVQALASGDVIVDGGNSYWGDSRRRAAELQGEGIRFLDVGTSGGVEGARTGACFMAGGDAEAVALVEPLLRPLAVEGGWVHAGPSGSGHFTKLVHNGIEFGMLQAIGEGIALLEAYPDALPVADVLHCWRNGSVIRGWLVDLMEERFRAHRGLDEVPSYVDDTGEVNWLVEDALRFEVPVPVISQAVMQLLASRDARNASARAVALLREGFGGHALGRAPAVAEERRTGRVSRIP